MNGHGDKFNSILGMASKYGAYISISKQPAFVWCIFIIHPRLHDDVDPLFLVALIQLELSGGRIGGGSELQTDSAVQILFRNAHRLLLFVCLM